VGENRGKLSQTSSNVGIFNAGDGEAGGLVGSNAGNIAQSYATGSVNASGDVGGLVGKNIGSIGQSYATGSAYSTGTSANGAGGLVGLNVGAISESYATGSAVGEEAGGLVGYNLNGTIAQSFATGAVATNASDGVAGGIVGANVGDIGNDVYWNTQTTGTQAVVGWNGCIGMPPACSYGSVPTANGLTTRQMTTPSSFAGYDFGLNGVWAMPVGSTHPVLAWQVESR
jgi:hypothetical protein